MKSTERIFAVCIVIMLLASAPFAVAARRINIPDIYDFKTLACDFHMHTVFSDGSVWPTIRVNEAFREGIDAIAITDHIEYVPKKDDIPKNLGRSHQIAARAAQSKNILMTLAAEITRSTPPGHFNALFLKDAKLLDIEDFMTQMRQAKEQEAFVFWNHPGWQTKKPDEKYILDIHEQLREKGLIHGVEIVNETDYYAASHAWALKHKLTLLGGSDIHAPSNIMQTTPKNHRTMTLVFVKEKTLDSLKEALIKGRTAVWFDDKLIGRDDFVDGIFKSSVELSKPYSKYKNNIYLRVSNNSDITYKLEKTGGTGPGRITLPANETIVLKTPVDSETGKAVLKYNVTNLLVAPEKGLHVTLTVP